MESTVKQRARSFWDSMGKAANGLTGDRALERFGLDWEPIPVPISYDYAGSRLKTTDFKLIVNSKTGQPICPANSTWKPLGNREFYQRARSSFEEMGGVVDRGGYIHGSKGSFRMGDRCAFLISNEMPDLSFALFDDKQERFVTRLIAANHQSPGSGISVRAIAIRGICSNGMVFTSSDRLIKAAHTEAGIEDYRTVKSQTSRYQDLIHSKRSRLEELAQVQLSRQEAREHFVNLVGNKKLKDEEQPFQVRALEAIYDGDAASLFEDRGIDLSVNDYTNNTAYGVLQAVTAYQTHFKSNYASPGNAIRDKVFQNSLSTKIMSSLERAYLPNHLRQSNSQRQSVRAF